MAPLYFEIYDSHNARYENNYDITVLADAGWGYRKIAKHMGMPVSTVQGVVKCYQAQGSTSIHDADNPGHPTKISHLIQQQIEILVQKDPQASLSEITEELHVTG
ncbi:hypothetical protein L873DRAFT_1793425 [Choiromyces venosus 120613-1]|uniref:Uncharacterized protein n=1 Tax=Choiromyces venosus 120613-1 TaxID=1336337 RepID=A0A3N4J979_9PEZI|nr:hypothetical protein L873DRAFT_1793425 [Choiromyces venosus 120613-1]